MSGIFFVLKGHKKAPTRQRRGSLLYSVLPGTHKEIFLCNASLTPPAS